MRCTTLQPIAALVRRGAALMLGVVLLLTAFAVRSQTLSLYFREVAKDGKIFLFNSDAQYRQFLGNGDIGAHPVTLEAYGPHGEQVISENQLAVDIYNIKHDKEPSAQPAPIAGMTTPEVNPDVPARKTTSHPTFFYNNDMELYMTLDTVGTLQALYNYDAYTATAPVGGKLAPMSGGFQNAFGNLGFGAKFGRKREIEMYLELYMDTWNHPSTTYGHEGYILIHDIPTQSDSLSLIHALFAMIDVKVGQFEIDFGDNALHRSNNGKVRFNPLVGNYVMDPNTTEIGGEVRTKFEKFGGLVGASSGTTTENFVKGHGTAWHAKVWLTPIKPLRWSASYYTVNHGRTPLTGGAVSTFFSGNRSGARYENVLNGNPGITPTLRKDVSAWQTDFGWTEDRYSFYGHYGQVWDDDINAVRALPSPHAAPLKESWAYYAMEGTFNFTRNFYMAGRYSAARAMKIAGVNSDGLVERFQAGVGYQFSRHVLLKTELVNQRYRHWRLNEVYNNLQTWKEPGYHGAVAEFALYY